MYSLIANYRSGRMKLADKKGMWLNSFFRQIAFALISGFSSVFIFSIGSGSFGPGGFVGGILLLMWFLVAHRFVLLVSVIFVSNYVIRRIGYKKSMLVSVFIKMLAFYFLSLAGNTSDPTWILVSGGLFGLGVCFYWIPFESLIPENNEETDMGSAFGVLEAIAQFGQVFAPVMGVIFALRFGYDYLFLFGIIFLFLSSFPMFFVRKHEHNDEVSWREFFGWSSEKTFLRVGVASAGRMVSEVIFVDLWPIYVFLLLGNIVSIGWLKSVIVLATAMFTLIVSKRFDTAKNNFLQVVGVSGGVVFWVLRLLVSSFPMVILVDALDRYFATASRIFFFGKLFRRAKGPESFSFIVYWEMCQATGVLLTMLFAIFWISFIGVFGFWPMLFGLAALGSVLSLLIQEHRGKNSV